MKLITKEALKGLANKTWQPVGNAVTGVWIDFWLKVQRFGGTLLFFGVAYALIILVMKFFVPGIFDLKSSGPISEKVIGTGLLFSPFSLLLYIIGSEVRARWKK